MRRFILSSTKMTGTVEVHYDTNDLLFAILYRAQLNTEQILWLKSKIPATGMYIATNFENSPITVEEKEFDITFEDFKREYPRKRNTHLAEAYWPKLSSANQYRAYIAAIKYAKHCTVKAVGKEFILLPEKFLKTQQWLNNWDE